MNKIYAVVGMCGSGKSEAVKFLTDNNCFRVYFGEVVINELRSLGLEINEQNERKVRESLRKQFGMGAMAVKSLPKIKEFHRKGNVVIESLYSWSEFKILDEIFKDAFKLIAVYTTKELRYARLRNRAVRPLSNDEAYLRDISEIENLDKGGPIAFADYLILNDGSLEDLYKSLRKLI